MTGNYIHLPYHIDFKTLKGRVIPLKRLTIGETLLVIINYRIMELKTLGEKAHKAAWDEAASLIIIDKKKNARFIQPVERLNVLRVALGIKNAPQDRKTGMKKDNENRDWLTKTIAFFMAHGHSRNEVLTMYPDEASAIMKEINEITEKKADRVQDRNFQAGYYAYNAPKEYVKNVVNKREKVVSSKVDINKLRDLEAEFLGRSFEGGKHAVQ